MRSLRLMAAGLILVGSCTAAIAAGTLRFGTTGDVTSVDPHFNNTGLDQAKMAEFYDPLVRELNGKLYPALAESWQAIDDRTWEFKLRQGVKWHDGSPFTAEDVAFTFSREGKIEGSTNSPLRYVARGANKKIRILDDYTIQIYTEAPYVFTPEDMAYIPIVSKKNGEGAVTADYNSGKAAIGTGPYKFVEWVKGDRLVGEANPDYWAGKPDFDRIVFKPIESNAARTAALLNGDVDFIDRVPPTDVPRFDASEDFSTTSAVRNVVVYLHLDVGRDVTPFVNTNDGEPMFPNPLRDWRVRKAMSMAINRQAIVDRVMEGLAAPAAQLNPAGHPGVSPNLKVEEYDLEGAKALLSSAGYGDGFEITIHSADCCLVNNSRVAETVAQMIARLGLKVNVELVPRAVYFPRSRAREFSIQLWGFSGEADEKISGMVACYDPSEEMGFGNVGRYCNQRVDDLHREAQVTTDEGERDKLFQQATEIAVNDLAVIPIHYQLNIWAMRQGLTFDPDQPGAEGLLVKIVD